ncbi:MAG TPA: flippase [Anaerolineales bacterium]|nr:flippase [Anaerolineales bacterium]
MRRSRSDLLAAVLLFALPLTLYWQVTLGGRTLIPTDNLGRYEPYASARADLGLPEIPHNMLVSDLVLENLLWKEFIRDSLAEGQLPLWNPYLFAGVPFLAAGQHSGLYPLTWLHYVLPNAVAFGWFAVGQLWLAGLGFYIWLRVLRLRRLAAVIGGVGFQLSGFMTLSVVFPMIVAAATWLPFLLATLELVASAHPWRGRAAVVPWLALGAVVIGLQVLAGHVEILYYSLLVSAGYAAWRLAGLRLGRAALSWREWFARATALLAVPVLGLALGAVQFLPLYELASSSFRDGRASLDQVLDWALPLRHVLVFLMPNAYGNASHHVYFDWFTRAWVPALNGTIDWGAKNTVEGGAYLGLLPLLLLPVAFRRLWRQRRLDRLWDWIFSPWMFFFVLAAFSLAFAFGTPLYAAIFWLPGISQLHSPFRWVFPLTVAVVGLAAFGLDGLLPGERDATGRVPRSQFARRIWGSADLMAALAIFAGVVTLLWLAYFYWRFDLYGAAITSQIQELAYAPRAFCTGSEPALTCDPRMFLSYEGTWAAVFAVLAIISGMALLSRHWQYTWRGRPLWAGAVGAVLAADLLIAAWGFAPAADPAVLVYEPPSAAFLRQDATLWRLTSYAPTGAEPYHANIPWLFRFQDIRGYDSLFSKQYADYMGLIQPQYQLDFNRIAPLNDPLALDSPLLDLLNVKYVVSDVPIDNPKYELVYDDEVRIYRNATVMPRAFTLPVTATIETDELARTILTYDPRRYVLVAPGDAPDAGESQTAPRGSEAGVATVTSYAGNEIWVDAAPTERSWLILGDTYADGWRAYARPIGGDESSEHELAITRVNGNFRGVVLEPGSHTVRFRYSPLSLRLGGLGSLLAGMVLVFMLGVWVWRGIYNESRLDSGARRVAKNALAPMALSLFNRLLDFAFATFSNRVLGPAEVGNYAYAVVIFGWFDTITNYGLNLLLTREVAADKARANRWLLNTTALRLWLGLSIIPFFAGGLLAINALAGAELPFALALQPLDDNTLLAIALLVLAQAPGTVSTGLTALFYAYEKAEVPAAIATVTTMLKILFGVAALTLGYGIVGLAGASLIVNVLTLGMLLGLAIRMFFRPQWEWDFGLQQRGLREGFPLMLNNLLAGWFNKIDFTLLRPVRGATEVGWYSAGYRYLDAFNIVPSMFTLSLFPVLSRQAEAQDRSRVAATYHFALKLLAASALPLTVAVTFLAEPMVAILGGSRFLPYGAIALRILAWSMPIGWMNSLTNYMLISLRQERGLTISFMAAVAFNVLLNLIFLAPFGYIGAAGVTIASETFVCILFYRWIKRAIGPVPWLELLWRPWLGAGLMLAATAALWPVSPALALPVGLLLYLGLLVTTRTFNPAEQEKLLSILPAAVRRRLVALLPAAAKTPDDS